MLALVLVCLFDSNVQAFYNPSTGRWLSRDPIEERGGANVMGFCQNDGIGRIDVLGRDYYIVTTEAACGVKHRVMIGDDGKGGHYRIDFAPVVEKWYQFTRRFCGKGKISVISGLGSADDAVGSLYDVETRTETTSEHDERIAQAAKSLDGKEMTYCLILRDCRAIDECVLERVLDAALWDAIKKVTENPPKK